VPEPLRIFIGGFLLIGILLGSLVLDKLLPGRAASHKQS
jgi:hypothetical protein